MTQQFESWHISKRKESVCPHQNCIGISMVALFITAKKRKPKCPSTDERINKVWYVHIIEYS